MGRGKDFVAMGRDHRLVGGDHVLAVGNGTQHQGARRLVAADDLDHHLDLRIVDHGEWILAEAYVRHGAGARFLQVARSGVHDAYLTPGAARDLAGIACQHIEGAGADGAQAQ